MSIKTKKIVTLDVSFNHPVYDVKSSEMGATGSKELLFIDISDYLETEIVSDEEQINSFCHAEKSDEKIVMGATGSKELPFIDISDYLETEIVSDEEQINSFCHAEKSDEKIVMKCKEKKPFGCSLCQYRTTKYELLLKHLLAHDVKSSEMDATGSNKLPFIDISDYLEMEIVSDEEQINSFCDAKKSDKKIVMKCKEKKPFSCSLCQYRTTKYELLLKHLLAHDIKSSEMDVTGSNKVPSIDISDYLETEIVSDEQQINYDEKSDKNIITKCKEKKPFGCSLCQYRTAKYELLLKHSLTHSFACSICDFKARSAATLAKHKTLHDSNNLELFSCSFCQFKTMEKIRMKKHLLTHSEKRFLCRECDFRSFEARAVETHFATQHSESDKPKFLCFACDYKTDLVEYIQRHVSRHREKLFTCPLCNYKGKFESYLKKHMKRHTYAFDDKPFNCDYCLMRTSTQEKLQAHIIRNHIWEKSYQCPLCDYRAPSSHKLKIHSVTHNEKCLKCEICDFRTNTKQNLRLHQNRHNGIVRHYNCDQCGYQTDHRGHLRDHIIAHSNTCVIFNKLDKRNGATHKYAFTQ